MGVYNTKNSWKLIHSVKLILSFFIFLLSPKLDVSFQIHDWCKYMFCVNFHDNRVSIPFI